MKKQESHARAFHTYGSMVLFLRALFLWYPNTSSFITPSIRAASLHLRVVAIMRITVRFAKDGGTR